MTLEVQELKEKEIQEVRKINDCNELIRVYDNDKDQVAKIN